MMNEILVNDIRNQLQAERNHILWNQFNKCNAYTSAIRKVIIGNDEYIVQPVMSYTTIVAFAVVTKNNESVNEFYEVGKYSRTTSKQVTQIYNNMFWWLDRFYTERRTA